MPHIEPAQLAAMQTQATALYDRANPTFTQNQRNISNGILVQVVADANVFYSTSPQYFDPSVQVTEVDIGAIDNLFPNEVRAASRRTALKNFLRMRNAACQMLGRPNFDAYIDVEITNAQQEAFHVVGNPPRSQPNTNKLFIVANLAAMRHLKDLQVNVKQAIDNTLGTQDPLGIAQNALQTVQQLAEMTQRNWFAIQYLEQRILDLPAEILVAQAAAQTQFDGLVVGGAAAYAALDDNAKHAALTAAQVAAPGTLQAHSFQALVRAELVQVGARIAARAAAQAQFEGFVGDANAYGALNDDAKHAALMLAQAVPVVGDPQDNHFRTLITAALGVVNPAIDTAAQQLFVDLTGPGTAYANGNDQVKHGILVAVGAGVGAGVGETDLRYRRDWVAAELLQVNARIAAGVQAAQAFDDLGGVAGAATYAGLAPNAYDRKHEILTAAQPIFTDGSPLHNDVQALITLALGPVNLAIDGAAQQLFVDLTGPGTAYANGDDQVKHGILVGIVPGAGETDLRYRRDWVAAELLQVNANIAAKNAAQAQFDVLGGGAAAYAALDDNAKHAALTAAQAPLIHNDIQQNHFQTLVAAELLQVNANIAAKNAAQAQFDTLTVNDNAYVGGDDAHKRGVLVAAQLAPGVGEPIQDNHLQTLVAAELAQVDARIASRLAAQVAYEGFVGNAVAYGLLDDNAKHVVLTLAQAAVPVADPIQEAHFRTLITAALGPVDLATTAAAQTQLANLGGYALLADDQAKRAVLAAVPPAVPPVTETERKFRILVINELARLAPAAMTFSSAADARTAIKQAPTPEAQQEAKKQAKRML